MNVFFVLKGSKLFIIMKCHIPLLGHYFQNKCLSESCCCIGSTFGVPIPNVDSAKTTASKKLTSGDPDFLTLWLEKVDS